MKATKFLKNITLIAASLLLIAGANFGQQKDADKKKADKKAAADKGKKDKNAAKTPALPAPVSADDNTSEKPDAQADDDEVTPYYNNYLKIYRLGPSDQISVEVFGQCPDYCKTGITVPPNARISYPLIRDGVMVAGKTVEQVAAEITQKLDEFIIDPKVTVTLDKAVATRYAVMGAVATPGVRVMDKKVSVYEAVLEAGGVTKDGNKNKVNVVRFNKEGRLDTQTYSLKAMETGKADMVYLNPGDQVFVEGKGFTITKFLSLLGNANNARVFF